MDERRPADEAHVECDERFHEAAALDEIELFSELLIAAGHRSAPLTAGELDALLGLRP